MAPGLQLLADCTRARDQGNKPHAFLQAQSQRAFTVGLTVGHNAAYPIEAERQTLLDRYGCLCAVTGIAIAQAHAERETLTTHPETQEDLLKIITPIGLDHGVGHSLLLLYDVKAPNGQKGNEFKGLGYYPSNASLSTL